MLRLEIVRAGMEAPSTRRPRSPPTARFGSDDAKLYAVAPGGTLVWSFATQGPVSASPAIGPRGEVAVGSHDGNLYAFR